MGQKRNQMVYTFWVLDGVPLANISLHTELVCRVSFFFTWKQACHVFIGLVQRFLKNFSHVHFYRFIFIFSSVFRKLMMYSCEHSTPSHDHPPKNSWFRVLANANGALLDYVIFIAFSRTRTRAREGNSL